MYVFFISTYFSSGFMVRSEDSTVDPTTSGTYSCDNEWMAKPSVVIYSEVVILSGVCSNPLLDSSKS